jgi:hypothetical protein
MGCGCNKKNHATATPEEIAQAAQDRAAEAREIRERQAESVRNAVTNSRS